jgi:hypothetical protein
MSHRVAPKRRFALLPLAAAAVFFAAGFALASPGEVVRSGIGFQADGKVVAKSADQVVIRTDDHGHRIAFSVDRSTVMPDDLAVGKHVHIVYHPLGSTGQTADKVQLTSPQTARR